MSKQFKNGDVITFGRHQGKAIKWYVIAQDDTSYTLFATKPLLCSQFGDDNVYQTSILRTVTNAILDDFTADELSRLVDNIDYFGDKIFVPNFEFVKELKYRHVLFDLDYIFWYWISSPSPSLYYPALGVSSSGANSDLNTYSSYGGVRPAVIIKKS